MKILSVIAQKPHSTGSGVFLTELVKGFAEKGMAQAVVCGLMPGDITVFPDNVKVYPVMFDSLELPFPVTGMSDEMPYRSMRYRDLTQEQTEQFEKAFMRRVKDAVRELEPDIILCHHLYLLTAMVRAMFPRQKVFGICHGSDLRQIKKNPLNRDFIQKQIRKLDGVLALHAVQRNEIVQMFAYDKARITVNGIGYNDTVFYNTGNSVRRPPLRLIFAGKVTEKKGIMSLLRCLNLLDYKKDELILKLAGGNGVQAEYEIIRRLADQCKYPVEFLGCLTQSELSDQFNQSHIFVLPSFSEGLPLVAIEAMACGLQVIMSDLPGIQEWLASTVKGNEVIYVKPPRMCDADVPVEGSLTSFEERLAAAVVTAAKRSSGPAVDLSDISWDGVCSKLVRLIKEGGFQCL